MPQSDNNATINNDELSRVVEEASKEIADLYVKYFGRDFAEYKLLAKRLHYVIPAKRPSVV